MSEEEIKFLEEMPEEVKKQLKGLINAHIKVRKNIQHKEYWEGLLKILNGKI